MPTFFDAEACPSDLRHRPLTVSVSGVPMKSATAFMAVAVITDGDR
jgi:hypothetical protein